MQQMHNMAQKGDYQYHVLRQRGGFVLTTGYERRKQQKEGWPNRIKETTNIKLKL
jgi:hypothetical protein